MRAARASASAWVRTSRAGLAAGAVMGSVAPEAFDPLSAAGEGGRYDGADLTNLTRFASLTPPPSFAGTGVPESPRGVCPFLALSGRLRLRRRVPGRDRGGGRSWVSESRGGGGATRRIRSGENGAHDRSFCAFSVGPNLGHREEWRQ